MSSLAQGMGIIRAGRSAVAARTPPTQHEGIRGASAECESNVS